jgi:hypothetical protein
MAWDANNAVKYIDQQTSIVGEFQIDIVSVMVSRITYLPNIIRIQKTATLALVLVTYCNYVVVVFPPFASHDIGHSISERV